MTVGVERRDVRVGPVAVAGLAIGGVSVAAFVLMWLVLGGLEAREARRSPAANPLRGTYGPGEPPEPRLQVDPAGDIRALRAEEQAILDGYGWVDRGAGRVRIPIARAMDLLVAERSR